MQAERDEENPYLGGPALLEILGLLPETDKKEFAQAAGEKRRPLSYHVLIRASPSVAARMSRTNPA